VTPQDVKEFYGNGYRLHKKTGMSAASLLNWIKWGYVPIQSQAKLQKLTEGALVATWDVPEK